MNKYLFNFLSLMFLLTTASITQADNDFFRYNGGICNGNNCSLQWQKIDVPLFDPLVYLLDPNRPWPTQVNSGQNVYELRDKKILRYNPQQIGPCPLPGCAEIIDSNPRTIKIVAENGQLFQLHNNGMIWRYLGSPNSWEPADNNKRTVDIVIGGGNLYQRHNNGQIWRYTWVPCSGNLSNLNCKSGWQMIDNNSLTMNIAIQNGTLYQVHHW